MARGARATRKRLGEILIEEGVIQEQQLLQALQQQRQSGRLLGETLVAMGFASEDDITGTIVIQFGLPYLSVNRYDLKDEMTQIFPAALLRQYQFVPVDRMGSVLAVVASGVLTPDILSELEQYAGVRILVYAGKQSEVQELIENRFGGAAQVEKDKAEKEKDQLSDLGSMLLGD